jgi:acyl-coenzyme A thioesterase PaaI-like protein
VDLRVDYLRPGNVDIDLFAQSKVLRIGNRVAATHTVLYQNDIDKPIATASAVYNLVTEKKF